jgi:flavin reductase (DIM6/NTAB) family NADH-FMN oxidoreductase RutF
MSLKRLNAKEIKELDKRKRVHLINSIVGFKCINLIGTVDDLGNENVAIFSSVLHLGSDPALIGFIIRPATVERNTLTNILETGYYTINHINSGIYEKAHQTSARYDVTVSEFDATQLLSQYKEGFKAPFVGESKVQIGMKFRERIDISINDTILIIGEIETIHYPEECMCEDGYFDLEKTNSLTGSGLDSYHETKRLGRLSYAKPEINLTSLPLNYVK